MRNLRLRRALAYAQRPFILPTEEQLREEAASRHEWWRQSGEDGDTPPGVDHWCWRVYGLHGWIYAMQLMPEHAPERVKLGYSTRLGSRIQAYRTICPNIHAIGLWPSVSASEENAITAFAGRKGRRVGGEVVDVVDISAALDRVSAYLRCPNHRYRMAVTGDWLPHKRRMDHTAFGTLNGCWPGPALPTADRRRC